MLEEVRGKKQDLLGVAPQPSNELPGQEEEMRARERGDPGGSYNERRIEG